MDIRKRRNKNTDLRPTRREHHSKKPSNIQSNAISTLEWSFSMGGFCLATFLVVHYSITMMPVVNENSSKLNQFKEPLARKHLQTFVGFGHRPAGSTANEINSVKYILEEVEKLKKDAAANTMKIETDVQHPTGSFTLNFLGGFASYYENITNTVVKLSSTKLKSNSSLLLNCHTDSVVGGPGASDDAVACSVLLEIIRALIQDKNKPLFHSVIFLFNGAEENVLQASHGFITQHKWAPEIKAFINLEAAGAGGKEVVFQTGPENPWLLQAWAHHAPHPFGTIVGQELFQSGVVPSDTDYRIFRDYGKIPGMDLAYIRNGYVYHTVYDDMSMIVPGCIQRAGDNILAVVKHLVMSHESLLGQSEQYKHGSAAFVDILGLYMFFVPTRLLNILNIVCCGGAFIYIFQKIMTSITFSHFRYGKMLLRASAAIILSWGVSLVLSLLLAALLTWLGRPMSFYRQPRLVVLLYVPPAAIGSVLVLAKAADRMFNEPSNEWKKETVFFDASLFLWSLILLQLTILQLHSSFILLIIIGPVVLFRCFLLRPLFALESEASSRTKMVSHLLISFFPMLIIISHCYSIMELFIPLSGRSGSLLPPDLLVGVLTSICITFASIHTASLVHLLKSKRWLLIGFFACIICSFFYAISDYGFPYSIQPGSVTPKRLFMQHTSRDFYGLDGKLAKSDSGVWCNGLDYGGMYTAMGPSIMASTKTSKCEGLFCRWPFGLPIEKLVRNPKYLMATRPEVPKMKEEPFTVKLARQNEIIVSENSTTRVSRQKFQYSISGPDHMSLTLGPLSLSRHRTVTISDWSIVDSLDEAKKTPSSSSSGINGTVYSEWIYIYYGSGKGVTNPWKPWFEITIVQNQTNPTPAGIPLLEVGVTAQYYSDDTSMPVKPQTPELQTLVDQLHSWVTPMSWVSVYRNYLL